MEIMIKNTYVSCIIAAAGAGSRIGGDVSKQFLCLDGKPIVAHTLEKFQSCIKVDEIILVVPQGMGHFCEEKIIHEYKLTKVKQIVSGGTSRQMSVYNGLRCVSPDANIVMIHDGVRPFVKYDEINVLIETTKTAGACCLGVRVKDTIKICDDSNTIISTPPRDTLWAVHTPQVFRRDIIFEAYEKAWSDDYIASDDATLVERLNQPVIMIEGSYFNIKITTPDDLLLAMEFIKYC